MDLEQQPYFLIKEISIRNFDQILRYLESSSFICEEWATEGAREIFNIYRLLIEDINNYKGNWSYSDYCIRLGYHFYNLASYSYTLYYSYKIDLMNVVKYLEKCIRKLNEISLKESDEEHALLKHAIRMKKIIDGIFNQELSKCQQNTASSQYAGVCISLGNIFNDQVFIENINNQSDVGLKQKVDNILLLRMIDVFEDCLSIPLSKSNLVLTERCMYLSRLYRLAKCSEESKRYSTYADLILKKAFISESGSNDNSIKQDIKNTIKQQITNLKSLEEINRIIEKENPILIFSSVEYAFMQRKYLKYCLQYWFQETENYLQSLMNDNNIDLILNILENIFKTRHISEIAAPLNELDSYKLLLLHIKLISQKDQQTYLANHNNACKDQVVDFCSFAKQELIFMDAFIVFLNTSKSHNIIFAELKLQLYYDDNLTFTELVSLINNLDPNNYGIALKTLQDSLKCLNSSELFMNNTFKDILKSYLKSVQINERYIDGRTILEVKGKSIVLSGVRQELENTLRARTDVQEIRFVDAEVFHVDQDLSKKIWHGKNIVAYAKKLKIYDQVTWDVSGLDNAQKYETDAGTDSEGNGNPGADGLAGESGGNILIISDEIDYPAKLTIISNGGDGSMGQDGGNGCDGEDGKGLTKAEFENKLPVSTKWFTNFLLEPHYIPANINFIKNCPTINKKWERNDAFYYEACTAENNKITMFCYGGKLFPFRLFQGLCLFAGSCGKVGKKGGEYGFGGQGGFGGEILVNSEKLLRDNNDGKVGANGEGGLFGYHGKNGWDIGYMYCDMSDTKFYGEYQNKKISIIPENETSFDNVYCHYRYVCNETDYYATFRTSEVNQNKNKFEERAKERQNKELQLQAKATKKKNISAENIRAHYTLTDPFEECFLQNTKSDIDNMLDNALNSDFKDQDEQEQYSTELNIKRNAFYCAPRKYHYTIAEQIKLTNKNNLLKNENGVHQIIDIIKNNPTDFISYLMLKSIELSAENISEIYSIFEKHKYNISAKEQSEIAILLTDKYRFTVLQKVSQILPAYEDNKITTKISPETASRFLTESEENSYDISHPIFGYITSYLFINNEENRRNIASFLKSKDLDDDDLSAIKNSLVLFVLEQGEKCNDSSVIKPYFDSFKIYTTKNDKKLMLILKELQKTLRRDEYIYHLWCQSFIDNSFKEKFINEISTDKLISSLYKRFNDYKNNKYDWGPCNNDPKVLEEYYKNISEHGTSLTCCLELLSHVYKINIRVYTEGKEGGYVLIGDHNQNGAEIIYLLRKGERFVKLDYDAEYHNLEENYRIKNDIYYKIIEDSFAVDSKLEVERCFEEIKLSVPGENKIHPILNYLEPYLFINSKNQRDNVIKLIRQTNLTDIALCKSIKLFILEEGKHEINECMNMNQDEVRLEYKNYIEFFTQLKHSLLCLVEPMEYEIRSHSNIFAIKDKSERKMKLQKELQNDPLFEKIYSKFCTQLASSWECYNYREIQDQFITKLDRGALEPCYREFLSFVYNVNIKVYVKKNNIFSLLCDHNPFSSKIIRVQQTKEKLFPLEEDETGMLTFYEVPSNIPKIVNIFDLVDFDENLEDIFHSTIFENNNLIDPVLSTIDDTNTINVIIGFFKNPEDAINVKNFLGKISVKYIGETKLLQHLLKRFKCEGMHVEPKILCLLVNLIFKFIIDDKNYLYIFNWIILSFPQKQWLSEIILLQLENYYRKKLIKKEEWRKYLLETENKDVLYLLSSKLYKVQQKVSMQCIDQILYLLSNIPLCKINLDPIDLPTWPCALKEKYWETKLKNIIKWNDKDSMSTAIYYILFMENIYGYDLIDKFIKIISRQRTQLTDSTFSKILSNLYNEKWNISEAELKLLSVTDVKNWMREMNKIFSTETERDVDKLERLVKSNANTSTHIKDLLDNIKKSVKLSDPNVFQIKSSFVSSFTLQNIENWSRKIKTDYENRTNISPNYELFLSIIDHAIFLKRGFQLRDTQKLTILSFLASQKNTLAQVSTGEGKSLIVVSLAIIKTLVGEKVDIITSSSVLAKRDAEGYADIYNLFEIKVSHNCNEDIEKRKVIYSTNQVVYGALGNFQRDYLLDRFYRKHVLGDRNFCNVIIDEVDSMLLDRGNNSLYLSHDLKGLDKLESVYIWQSMNRLVEDSQEFYKSLDQSVIKEAILYDIFGTILKKDLITISDELNDEKITILYNRIIKFKLIDEDGKLLINDMSDINIDEILSTDYNAYKDEFIFLIKETIEREKRIQIPNYLKGFVLRHLDSWISNAQRALYLKEGRDYVVDVDRTETSPDMNPKITIIDIDTGTDQANSEWEEVLHQFLQLKHGCKLSPLSLKAVFISNVSYFKLYETLYGLTGTLGSKTERNLLETIHNVQFVTIPTAKPKNFFEHNPILCLKSIEWQSKIFSQAKILTEDKNRSVLIICETLDEVESLFKIFGGKQAKNVYTYIRDYEKFEISNEGEKLSSGVIIIATNLAGRGTDIKLSDELKLAGGLHVLLTYLPKNSRIEQQAFGRAARCGEMGSGQLIIMSDAGEEFSCAQLLSLKTNRNVEEARRIAEIQTFYNNQVQVEEQCFRTFKDQYDNLKVKLDIDKIPKDFIDILLQCCLDNWAYWLDENSKLISNSNSTEYRKQFDSSFREFIKDMEKLTSSALNRRISWIDYIFDVFVPKCKESYEKTSYATGWIQDPMELTNLGKKFAKNKYYDEAIKIYDIVISRESRFSEASHYYKAFALAKTFNSDIRDREEFKEELKKAATLIQSHCEFATNAASIIGEIKQNTINNFIKINAYEEQKTAIINYYSPLLQSINEILGSSITPHSFASSDINEELAETIYQDLLSENVLKRMEINDLSPEKLQSLAYGYGLMPNNLMKFLSSYKGHLINEAEFQNKLRQNIHIPNRENFWKTLKAKGVWEDEIVYVVINKDRLKLIDPSLLTLIQNKIEKNELHENSFYLDSRANIYLYTPEELQKLNKNIMVIKKEDFKSLLGNDLKYKKLKEKGILTKNKRAAILLIDEDYTTKTEKKTGVLLKENRAVKLEAIAFPFYDSIKPEDFAEENITKTVAQKILDELVKNEVLKFEDETYRLNVDYKKLTDVKLKSFPVYENCVHTLLRLCFANRIALQKVKDQINRGITAIEIKLMSKPHTLLMMEMIDLQVIKPSEISNKPKGLEDELKKLYTTKIIKNELKSILTRHNFLDSEFDSGTLITELQKQGWVEPSYNPDDPLDTLTDIVTIKKNTDSHLDAPFNCFEETLRLVFKNVSNVSQPDCIQRIAHILEQSVSSLVTLDTPDADLEPINWDHLHNLNVNVQEVRLFFLNCLDELITFKEKKWTVKMKWSVFGVIVIGIAQIIIGAIIEIFSMGAMTHVASFFISEGVGDIMYALGALHSGYFSWKDYGIHKLYSVTFTAITFGLAAFLSRGVNVSRIGNKVIGPTVEIGGKKGTEMTGKTLCNTLTKEVVFKETLERIAGKTIEGFAYGAASTCVDMLIENGIKKLCGEITYSILSNIENEVEGHGISKTLETIYSYLGLEDSKKIINKTTEKYFQQESIVEKFSPIASKIFLTLKQGIAEASKKKSKLTEQKTDIVTIINSVSKLTGLVRKILNLYDLVRWIKTFLDNLNQQLRVKLNKIIKDKKLKPIKDLDKQCVIMKMDIVTNWKKVIKDKAGQVVAENIVRPLFQEVANNIVKITGKYIQKVYNDCKENGYKKQLDERKQQYLNELAETEQVPEDNTRWNDVKEKYHGCLIKIMQKTKNPQLLADIIDEDVPMDMTCVAASEHFINRLLESLGKNPVKIIVSKEGGFKQTFSSTGDNNEGDVINLTLKDNHFVFSGNESTENNNCLFSALKQRVPELNNMTPEIFRQYVVHEIRTNKSIHIIIESGRHHFPLSQGAYGGRDKGTDKSNKAIFSINPMKTEIEKDINNGKYFADDCHKYNDERDVDLRRMGTLSNSETHDQRAEAFQVALRKINETLEFLQKGIQNPVFVSETCFETTMSDPVLVRTAHGNIGVGLCPVEMKSSIQLHIKTADHRVETAKFTLELNMDNPETSSVEHGPRGAHIGYSVTGCKIKETGHVFINRNKDMPRREKESKYTSDFKPNNKIEEAAVNQQISPIRMFYSSTRPNVPLQRVHSLDPKEIDKKDPKLRRNRYPSHEL